MRAIKGFVLGVGVWWMGVGLAPGTVLRPAINDFDGDGRSDQGFYSSFSGKWEVWMSAGGSWDTSVVHNVSFGFPHTVALPGDFDGDGLADYAVYYPHDHTWYLGRSQAGYTNFAFGLAGTAPVTGDFDGDGRTDVGCYEPASGRWMLRQSSAGVTTVTAGVSGSLPVVADYDGDGRADPAAYRPDDGLWVVRRSSAGNLWTTNFAPMTMPGAEGNHPRPMPGDYDGDGRADLAVLTGDYNVNGIQWLQSTQGRTNRAVITQDVRAGDYDGDGRTDLSWVTTGAALPYTMINVNPNRPDQTMPAAPFRFYGAWLGGTRTTLDRHDFSWFVNIGMSPYNKSSQVTPLLGTTARGRTFRLTLPAAFSRVPGTYTDASGAKATAYLAGFDDQAYFDSPGTAKTGPITFAGRSTQAPPVFLARFGFDPFIYQLNLYVVTIEGTYRDNAGETTATLTGAYLAVVPPSFNF